MIGTAVKRKADRQPFQVTGWSESERAWILSPLNFAPLVLATPTELLTAFSGAKPDDVEPPKSEAEIKREQDNRASTEAVRAYGAVHAKPQREHAPPPDSPEDRFANGTAGERVAPEGRASRKALEIALEIVKDRDGRYAAWLIGAIDVHPDVDRELLRIAEASA